MLNPEILETFQNLLAEAKASSDPEPTAMTLSTADGTGRVSSRVVLLKGIDAQGPRFFTNYLSDKGVQLDAHPQVALNFHWKHLREGVQVRLEGRAEKLPAADSDAYFASRPRMSQIGAWASLQSQTLPDRDTFERRLQRYEAQFEGRAVMRPEHWGGFVVDPQLVEFWYAEAYRLHDRVRWEQVDGNWQSRHLYP